MCTIGIFIIGYALTQMLALSRKPGPSIWRRGVAATRYLSYRGFHVKVLGWNSAPIGVLLLGVTGAIYFFCALDGGSQLIKETRTDFLLKAWIWHHPHTIGRVRIRLGATRRR